MSEQMIQQAMEEADPVRLVSDESLERAMPQQHLLSRLRSDSRFRQSRTSQRRLVGVRTRMVAAVTIAAAIASGATFAGVQVADAGSGGAFTNSLAQVRGELADGLLQNYPQQYGGTDLTESGGVISVYMTSVPAGFAAFLNGYVPASEVDVIPVAHSLLNLDSVANQISSAFAGLQAAGITIASTQVDFPSSTVIVNVVNLTTADVAQLDSEFGAGNITVNSVSATTMVGSSGALITERPITGN
jgi:hypothetical protein